MEKYRKNKAELSSKDDYRDRSRSPHRKQDSDSSRDKSSASYRLEEHHRRKRTKSSSISSDDDDLPTSRPTYRKEVKKAPPPPVISKISMSLKSTSSSSGIQMKLNAPVKPSAPKAKPSVASAFNEDSDDEIEEMPAEARMRMRNIGKNTPTSSGPNSFGKTKQGFVDSKKMFEKKMQQLLKDMPE